MSAKMKHLIMFRPKIFKKLFFVFFILYFSNLIPPKISVVGDPMSTTDGDELLASFQNLDMNTKKITEILNGYNQESISASTKPSIDLHPSLWSSEYYQIVNPKTSTQTVLFNKSSVQQQLEPNLIQNKDSNDTDSIKRNKTFKEDFLARLKTRNRKNLKERRQSSYKIQRENNDGVANEVIGFGASSRTVVKPVSTNNSEYSSIDKSDNALKWIKTSG